MEVTKQNFRIGKRQLSLFATNDGKAPLINLNNQVREFSPEMAGRILGIIAHMERERGNARVPAKVTPHRLEIQGWRELTPEEIEVWAAGAKTRDDMHIGSKKRGKVSRTIYPDGIEKKSIINRTSEQDAEKDKLRQLLAAKEAELEALKAQQTTPIVQEPEPSPEEKPVTEPEAGQDEPEEKPQPKKRGRKRKTTTTAKAAKTEGGEE